MKEKELTPKEIVRELDKYIIGQSEAKKAVAVALRNRWRRQQLPEDFKDEVAPKNIIMIGPTGVGKTEIARRLARLVNAPFIKVEATKFTEVGYVGRNVESIIADLVEIAVNMVKQEKMEQVRDRAKELALDRLAEIMVEKEIDRLGPDLSYDRQQKIFFKKLEIKGKLKSGEFDDELVEINVKAEPSFFSPAGGDLTSLPIPFLTDLMSLIGGKTRKVKVKEALKILEQEEAQKLIDMDEVIREAIKRAEEQGIVFIDEIDKVATRSNVSGADISREGVQRDLLPIVEGSKVATKYGLVKTDHMLFIAAGAFHIAKPSDLLPELQGRFPVRVELKPLKKEDFVKILTEPNNALTKQYKALLATEGIELEFTQDGVEQIAEIAEEANKKAENIGARRLHTVMEKLLEDISFNAPELKGKKITIDSEFVRQKLSAIIENEDLTRFIL